MIFRILIGSLVGGIAGFLYYKLVGCYNGSCLIKSDPVLMTIYGAVLLSLIFELLHEARELLVKYIKKER